MVFLPKEKAIKEVLPVFPSFSMAACRNSLVGVAAKHQSVNALANNNEKSFKPAHNQELSRLVAK